MYEFPYRVKLPVYEGPLDLLIHLININEIDIYNIPIAKITNEYFEYINFMKELNLEVASEFILLAATLIYIKSKSLLPKLQEDLIEEDELDPQAALDRGRFQLEDGLPNGDVLVEDSIDSQVVEELRKRGHRLRVLSGLDRFLFGLGQIILRDRHEVYWGGSDPRGDGCAIGLP